MKMRAAVLRQSGLPRPYASSKPLNIEEIDLEAEYYANGGQDDFD